MKPLATYHCTRKTARHFFQLNCSIFTTSSFVREDSNIFLCTCKPKKKTVHKQLLTSFYPQSSGSSEWFVHPSFSLNSSSTRCSRVNNSSSRSLHPLNWKRGSYYGGQKPGTTGRVEFPSSCHNYLSPNSYCRHSTYSLNYSNYGHRGEGKLFLGVITCSFVFLLFWVKLFCYH